MTDKQVIIDKYFYMMRDENGRIFGIQEIGDIRQLIKDIREQNEYIQVKEQECEELKKEIAFGNNGTLSDKIRAIVFKDLNKENNKLKPTLDDIKKILLINKRELEECLHNDIDGQIMKKISECEVEEWLTT